jgi:hypothetical protein
MEVSEMARKKAPAHSPSRAAMQPPTIVCPHSAVVESAKGTDGLGLLVASGRADVGTVTVYGDLAYKSGGAPPKYQPILIMFYLGRKVPSYNRFYRWWMLLKFDPNDQGKSFTLTVTCADKGNNTASSTADFQLNIKPTRLASNPRAITI